MRIAVGSRVSTEAWRFDQKEHKHKEEDRWSYSHFQGKWRDARVYGTVESRGGGDKWEVLWDIDQSLSSMRTDHLQIEATSCPIQSNFFHYVER